MTTLELAEAIARAVLAVLAEVDEEGQGDEEGWMMPHNEYFPDTAKRSDKLYEWDLRQIIFTTLRAHGAWFCRITEGPPPVGGIVKMEQMEFWP